ncbi:GNAT family N-acetyltransferase [Rhizobium sp. 007]|uniref:GNAT family N-acetyltransferase n=1 Tax=Rhizobium sp. 007 TaxID=2785056 RepID=UPI00188E21D8|nr:GNAT family N-acetyltransferase [Rhizobium sp. 007]QPB21241.1 GNAT family N-acetyltransferase [Rhizobium sp. 007]
MTPNWSRNFASVGEIARHLNECGGNFATGLSARIDIEIYAQKILLNAERFEAWSNGILVGFLAMYCNDDKQKSAFITNVSVLEDWRGRGIAGTLLEQCITHADEKGFDTIRLEVEAANVAAVAVYGKFGFVPLGGGQSTLMMKLDLGAKK